MQGLSYQVKIVLEQYDARNKTFLTFKDSPGNPLGRSPPVACLNGIDGFTCRASTRSPTRG